jgi:hypothetical protein
LRRNFLLRLFLAGMAMGRNSRTCGEHRLNKKFAAHGFLRARKIVSSAAAVPLRGDFLPDFGGLATLCALR